MWTRACFERTRRRWLGPHEVHTSGTHGTRSQPPRTGHHELRSADQRVRQSHDHGRRARRGRQLLRHRERLWLGREQGPHRGDPRYLVRPGRRAPGQGRPGDEGVREHGRRRRRLAQPPQALRAEHPARRRRQPQAAPDGPHRPVPVPPHRPGHPGRRDLAGRRRPDPAGQDPLRGLVQLRRLEDRADQRDGAAPGFVRPGQ